MVERGSIGALAQAAAEVQTGYHCGARAASGGPVVGRGGELVGVEA